MYNLDIGVDVKISPLSNAHTVVVGSIGLGHTYFLLI
jgi:hypothetical protein